MLRIGYQVSEISAAIAASRVAPSWDAILMMSKGQGSIAVGPKRLELLRELLPKASKIAMLVNPKSLNSRKKIYSEKRAVTGGVCIRGM